MYPRIFCGKVDEEDFGLTQLLDTAAGGLNEAAAFNGQDCVAVITACEQYCDEARPYYLVHFAMPSSERAEKFFRYGENGCEYAREGLDSFTTDMDGNFCVCKAVARGEAEQRAGRFLVQGCIIHEAGEAISEDCVKEIKRVVESVFMEYYGWLQWPGRNGRWYAMKIDL